jgi:hypothetical protein
MVQSIIHKTSYTLFHVFEAFYILKISICARGAKSLRFKVTAETTKFFSLKCKYHLFPRIEMTNRQ